MAELGLEHLAAQKEETAESGEIEVAALDSLVGSIAVASAPAIPAAATNNVRAEDAIRILPETKDDVIIHT